MNQFDLETALVKDLLNSELFSHSENVEPFLAGNVFKHGTRFENKNEDVVVDVQSINDRQIQQAVVSIRFYFDDIDIGAPLLVPNLKRMQEVADKVELIFKKHRDLSFRYTGDTDFTIDSFKRERREQWNQHCLNLMMTFRIPNFGRFGGEQSLVDFTPVFTLVF